MPTHNSMSVAATSRIRVVSFEVATVSFSDPTTQRLVTELRDELSARYAGRG